MCPSCRIHSYARIADGTNLPGVGRKRHQPSPPPNLLQLLPKIKAMTAAPRAIPLNNSTNDCGALRPTSYHLCHEQKPMTAVLPNVYTWGPFYLTG